MEDDSVHETSQREKNRKFVGRQISASLLVGFFRRDSAHPGADLSRWLALGALQG